MRVMHGVYSDRDCCTYIHAWLLVTDVNEWLEIGPLGYPPRTGTRQFLAAGGYPTRRVLPY